MVNAGKHVALFYTQKTQEKDIKKAHQRTAYGLSEAFKQAHISVHIEGEKCKTLCRQHKFSRRML